MHTCEDHDVPAYVRPPLVIVPTLDDAGEPVVYGSRWGLEGPPEWAYSLEAHPERFAPLHTIADALVAHLVATYLVTVRDVDPASLTRQPAPTADRAVLLQPEDADAAPLTIVWTTYPGILLRAGARWRNVLPMCGCVACDDAWEPMADELERSVLAVADGRLQEEGDGSWSLELGDDSRISAGPTPPASVPGDDVVAAAREEAAARSVLAGRTQARWTSWPVRSRLA